MMGIASMVLIPEKCTFDGIFSDLKVLRILFVFGGALFVFLVVELIIYLVLI
jgi:hypothetical protein